MVIMSSLSSWPIHMKLRVKQVQVVLLLLFICFILSCNTSYGSTNFEEYFSSIDPKLWSSYGPYSCTISSSAFGRTGVLNVVGSDICESGLVSANSFLLNPDFSIESDIYIYRETEKSMVGAEIGLTMNNNPISECSGQYSKSLTLGIIYAPPCEGIECETMRESVGLTSVQAAVYTDNNKWERFEQPITININSWNKLKIAINSNKKAEFYVNGNKIYTSSNRINDNLFNGKKILIGCFSSDGGKSYIDEIKLSGSLEPEITKIIITGKDSREKYNFNIANLEKNPTAGFDVKFEAIIANAPNDYKIDWTIINNKDKKTEFAGEGNPFNVKTNFGTYGKKKVYCKLSYNHGTNTVENTKEFNLYFDNRFRYLNSGGVEWADDNPETIEPNWFNYWKKDGAVLPEIYEFEYNDNFPGRAGSHIGGNLYLHSKAADNAISYTVNGINFPALSGIDLVANTIKHELYHKWVNEQWNGGSFKGMQDSDHRYDFSMGKWWDDGLPDFYETDQTKNCPYQCMSPSSGCRDHKKLITDPQTTDTYYLHNKFVGWEEYEYYGDQEYLARVCANGYKGITERDWSNNGKQSNDGYFKLTQREISNEAQLRIDPPIQTKYSLLDYTKILGNYSDEVRDINNNSLYDILTLKANISINKTGYYFLIWNLNDTNGTMVASKSCRYLLNNGTYQLNCDFDGFDINRHKLNGPYFLTLALYSEGLEMNLIDFKSNIFETKFYNYTDFEGQQGSLTHRYFDYGEDTNGDSKFDNLIINVEVKINIGGNYTIEGFLINDKDTTLDFANKSLYLNPGTNYVQLCFDGKAITQRKINGSYILNYLSLFDELNSRIDFVYDAYKTKIYTYNEFFSYKNHFATLSKDEGEDINGDGIFEYLSIDIGVNISNPGNYTIAGILYDSNSNELNDSITTKFAEPGIQVLRLRFASNSIFNNSENGKFIISNIRLYNESNILMDMVSGNYSTNYYKYTDFGPYPHIYVEKTSNLSSAPEGAILNYTIKLINDGNIDLNPVSVIDSLPLGLSYISDDQNGLINGSNISWNNLGELDIGATKLIHIICRIERGSTGTIDNAVYGVGKVPSIEEVYVKCFNNSTIKVLIPGIVVQKTLGLSEPIQFSQFCENKKVAGTGIVDISTNMIDKKLALKYRNSIAGNGDIELESENALSEKASKLQRSLGNNTTSLNLYENTKLIYSGKTLLSGGKYLESKEFFGGIGARIQEAFSINEMEKDQQTFFASTDPTSNEVDKDRSDQLRNASSTHLVALETKNTFNGTWGTDATWHKILYKEVNAHEMFAGRFEAEKLIKFHENPVPEENLNACRGIDC